MEDKTFNLLEKMYIDLTDKIDNLNSKFTDKIDNLSSEFSEFRKETNERFDKVDANVIRIENNHGAKLDALADGYTQTYEKLTVLEEKLDNLSDKVDRHDVKIQVIEGGRK